MNSGDALNLHQKIIAQFNILTTPCNPLICVMAVDNAPIVTGQITQQTIPILIQVGHFHAETINLYVISSSCHPIILGYPWLSLHDPLLSWKQRELLQWSPFCQKHCLTTQPIRPCLTTGQRVHRRLCKDSNLILPLLLS